MWMLRRCCLFGSGSLPDEVVPESVKRVNALARSSNGNEGKLRRADFVFGVE